MHALIVQLLGCSEAESHGAKSLLISSFQYTSQPSGFVAFMKCGTPLACRMPTSFHSRLGTTARSAFRWMFLQRRRASSLVSKNPYRGKNTEPRRPGPGRRSCRGWPATSRVASNWGSWQAGSSEDEWATPPLPS